jgi:hypothetical protein
VISTPPSALDQAKLFDTFAMAFNSLNLHPSAKMYEPNAEGQKMYELRVRKWDKADDEMYPLTAGKWGYPTTPG